MYVKEKMSDSQNLGIIKLSPKSGDLELIENWRPISLLNVDYKIISKTIANRLKNVLEKIISPEQYCGVPNRSIINCNNSIRDIVNYVRENNLKAGLLNLDWSKAFDRVNMTFLFKVMSKFGFSPSFISLIKVLYKDCKSMISINGLFSEKFDINRSVRQGCPLSMLLYIIYQEPLYLAIKANSNIVPPLLPNNVKIVIQGFADDSTVLFATEESLKSVCLEIKMFEAATGSLLNKNKSCILGLGAWSEKNEWPLKCFKSVECAKILGIYVQSSFFKTCEMNWTSVVEKVRKSVNMLSQRYLTLYQRTVIVNSLILSKVWYLSHTPPLSKSDIQKINATIIKYIWGGMYRPIKRNTLYLPKLNGGLGLISVEEKSNSIFIASCLKNILNNIGLSRYYCTIRLSYVIQLTVLNETAYYTPS